MKRFYDVAVVGGGAAGIAAALAAAECGRSVVLIEDYGFFGGTATISGVQSYCGFLTSGPHPERVVAGMGLRVLEALQAFGHPVEPVLQSSGNWIILLDPERLSHGFAHPVGCQKTPGPWRVPPPRPCR